MSTETIIGIVGVILALAALVVGLAQLASGHRGVLASGGYGRPRLKLDFFGTQDMRLGKVPEFWLFFPFERCELPHLLVFDIHVANRGARAAEKPEIVCRVPSGLSFERTDVPYDPSGGTKDLRQDYEIDDRGYAVYRFRVDDIKPGQSFRFTPILKNEAKRGAAKGGHDFHYFKLFNDYGAQIELLQDASPPVRKSCAIRVITTMASPRFVLGSMCQTGDALPLFEPKVSTGIKWLAEKIRLAWLYFFARRIAIFWFDWEMHEHPTARTTVLLATKRYQSFGFVGSDMLWIPWLNQLESSFVRRE